jgi:hypothetical protein
LLGVIFGKRRGSASASAHNPESIELDKIPRLSLSDIVQSLGCSDVREDWGKRIQILSDAQLKRLRDQWIYHGGPSPELMLEKMFRGYRHDNDVVGLVLLCSYFDWLTPNDPKLSHGAKTDDSQNAGGVQ